MAVRRCPHQEEVTIFHTRPGQSVHLTVIRQTSEELQDPPLHRENRRVLGQCLGASPSTPPRENERVHARGAPPHGKRPSKMLPRGSRPTLQSYATPLGTGVPHPGRGRTRAEQPETSSLRPPKTTVRRTPSTPHRLHRATRRRGHRGLGRSRGLLLRQRRRRGSGQVLQARGPFWRDGPWKGRDDLEAATARWVNWYNHTRPHLTNDDDLSPAAAEHRYHRNHTTTATA